MAFPQSNAQRELNNRKILEEIQLQKQMLLKQGAQPTTNSNSIPAVIGAPIVTSGSGLNLANVVTSEPTSLNSQQRAALQSAHTQSFGYFITQDSAFGNLILPVLPRFDKQLIQPLDGFTSPKILLEQYQTPIHLATHMLHTIQSQYNDIDGKLVGDLGCGTGILTIGAAVMEASLAIGFEIDLDALEIFNENLEESEVNNVDLIQADILNNPTIEKWYGKFDTIIMNPPFGTKHNEGIDMKFLQTAFQLSTSAVYSLHKTSTRKHVLKVAKNCGVPADVLAEMHYDLPASYRFHKKASVDIAVDFYRFDVSQRVA